MSSIENIASVPWVQKELLEITIVIHYKALFDYNALKLKAQRTYWRKGFWKKNHYLVLKKVCDFCILPNQNIRIYAVSLTSYIDAKMHLH